MRSGTLTRVLRCLPLAALMAAGGCFATRNDVRVVQADIAAMRTELLRNDADQKEAVAQALRLITVVNDSLTRLSGRTTLSQGDLRGEMRSIRDQLIQVQTLLGQSQQYIQRLRAEQERARNEGTPPGAAPPVTPPATTTGAPPVTTTPVTAVKDTTPPEQTVGPASLYQTAKANLDRGSWTTARVGFQKLLSDYPESDFAPDAQFYIAESLAREKNNSGADAAYAAVVSKYPESARAPNALYKRAKLLLSLGNTATAKPLFEMIIKRYPNSDEAGYAAEELKTIR